MFGHSNWVFGQLSKFDDWKGAKEFVGIHEKVIAIPEEFELLCFHLHKSEVQIQLHTTPKVYTFTSAGSVLATDSCICYDKM